MIAQHQISALNLVALASEHQVHAVFALDDSLRSDAIELVQKLHTAGKHLYLFSGDHTAVVQRITIELGIENMQANLTPADKLAAARTLQQHS